MKKFSLLLFICTLVLSSCAPAPTAVPEPTVTPEPTAPPLPTDTPSPTSTSDAWEHSLTQIPTVSRQSPDLPEGYIYVHTWCNDKINAEHNFSITSPLGFKYGWTASEMDQIDGFLHTVLIELKLDGQLVVFDGTTDVIFNQKTQDYTIWFYKLIGTMAPGDHKLEQKMTFTEHYEDGTEIYGPGTEFEESVMACDLTIEE